MGLSIGANKEDCSLHVHLLRDKNQYFVIIANYTLNLVISNCFLGPFY